MPEVLATYDKPVIAPDGTAYRAQAVGSPAADGTARWEGWIEFLPLDGGSPLVSRRETTQPNRRDTAYWATGLSPVYLSGTLERTLRPAPDLPPVQIVSPVSERPAPSGAVPLEPEIPTVLNPFSVYRKGEDLLRSQLAALSAGHLVNIIRANGLSDLDAGALSNAPHQDLAELIVAGVKLRVAR